MRPALTTSWILACALAGASTAARADEPPRLADMAYSITLQPLRERPVLQVPIPEVLYRGVVREDLGDVRVFNDDGEQVPFAIRALDDPHTVDPIARSVPFFPLHAAGGEVPAIEGLSVALAQGEAHAHIDLGAVLAPRAPGDAGVEAPLTAYILDTSRLDEPIAALRFELAETAADYVLPVRVESSQDLGSFSRVDSRGTVVSLRYGDARIERDRIELSVRAPFLRVRLAGDADWPAPLAAVHAEPAPESRPADRVTTSVVGVPRDGELGVYDFDLGGFIPADRGRVMVPRDNTLVRVTLRPVDPDGKAEAPVFQGFTYRVRRDGELLQAPAFEFSRTRRRHWRLEVDPQGGGLGNDLPRLELARHPDQLLFVARGRAPFHLGYGHHAAEPAGFNPHEVLQLMAAGERELGGNDARASMPQKQAGERALSPPPPPPPYKRYLLWAVLIVAALLLIASAVRMLRQGPGAASE